MVSAQQQETLALAPQEELPKAFKKASPSVVKIVSDSGKNIGAGVIVGVHDKKVGFILTSYSLVAGRAKVAVILRNYPDALLGYVVEKFIDFDLDLAIIAVKDFPAGQSPITFAKGKDKGTAGQALIISHRDVGDWVSSPAGIQLAGARFYTIELPEADPRSAGAPLLTEKGDMFGLVVSEEPDQVDVPESTVMRAVNTMAIIPILNEWFSEVDLSKKWRQRGGGVATWLWAVGGGILGSTVVSAIALSGGSGAGPQGLPRPPKPPQN